MKICTTLLASTLFSALLPLSAMAQQPIRVAGSYAAFQTGVVDAAQPTPVAPAPTPAEAERPPYEAAPAPPTPVPEMPSAAPVPGGFGTHDSVGAGIPLEPEAAFSGYGGQAYCDECMACNECTDAHADCDDLRYYLTLGCRCRTTCNMYQHYPYFPTFHGYYYFRPYHWTYIRRDQEIAARLGEDPRFPYQTTVFDYVYDALGIEAKEDAELPLLPRLEAGLPNLEDLLNKPNAPEPAPENQPQPE